MVKKLMLAVSFIVFSLLLPLIAKPSLILHYKSLVIMLAIVAIWATQPPISKKETLENKGRDKFSVLLIIIMSIVSVAAPVIDWAYFMPPRDYMPVTVLGLGIIAAGIIFRIWAIQTLGKHFTPTVQLKEDHSLITSGPYAIVRHPSYLGAMWAITGTAIFLNSVAGTIISFACMFYAYYIRISTEEEALAGLFGSEYKTYQQKVKRLIPLIW